MCYTMTYLPLVHVCYWSEFAVTKLLEFEVFLLLVNKKGAKVSISKGKIIPGLDNIYCKT